MRPRPPKTEIPAHLWDQVEQEYTRYAYAHGDLTTLGLSDEAADAYLDAHRQLSQLTDEISPYSPRFRSDSHRLQIAEAISHLQRMAELLGYDLSTAKGAAPAGSN